jgi:hypothetical protein
MAVADFTNPKLTQDYTTLLQSIRDMQSSQALMHDSTGAVNVPTGTIRWSSTNNRDEKFNGSVWVAKSSTYAIDVSTLASYAPSQSATNSTVAVRDASGNLLATGFSSSSANNTAAVTFVMTKNGSNFINPSTAAQVKTFLAYTSTEVNGMYVGLGTSAGLPSNIFISTNDSANTTSPANLAIGLGAGVSLSSGGGRNIALGVNSLQGNTSGSENVGVGVAAIQLNSTGSGNVGVGDGALYNTTSSNNIGVGYRAGLSNTSGSVTAVGYRALTSSTTGTGQTAVGYNALAANTGSDNTAVGSSALLDQLGASNTAIGFGAMNSAARTTIQATALGVYAGGFGGDYNNSTCLGYSSSVTGDNQVQLGDNRTTTYAYGAVQNRSDRRDKANIRDSVLGLDFINKLRPVDFQWDMRDFYRTQSADEDGSAISSPQQLSDKTPDGSKKRSRYHHGVIAQEVQAVIESTGVDFGGFQDHSRNGGDDVMSIGYEEFIAPLIKAVQELSAKNNSLEARLAALEAKL